MTARSTSFCSIRRTRPSRSWPSSWRPSAIRPGPGCSGRATVVAKHFRRAVPGPAIGLLRSVRERRFGETTLTFYRRVAMEDG